MVAQLDRMNVRASPGRALPRLISYALFEGRPATTRGAWINPVVAANLHAGWRIRRRSVWRRPVVAPVFLVGIGRSGTTLLGRLLGAHPDVGFLNEPKAMWHRIIDDEDLIGSYGPEPVRLRLDADDATTERRAVAHAIYSWYLSLTRSARVVDKYPELVYRLPFVRGVFPDAHVVAIIRAPWDVVTSIESWDHAHATDDATWWGIDDRKWRVLWRDAVETDPRWADVVDVVDSTNATPIERATVEWLVGTCEALDHDAEGSGRFHLIRYDDLVADPVATISDVLRRCDLTEDPRVLGLAEATVTRTRHPATAPESLDQRLVALVEATAVRAGF